MDSKTYIMESSRTCPDLGSDFNNKLHMIMGIVTESGELMDAFKKNFAYNKPLDNKNVAEEIGDCFWYLYNLCRIYNINPEDIMENNIEKLRARYPEKFTQYNAINRDLSKEREIIEKINI